MKKQLAHMHRDIVQELFTMVGYKCAVADNGDIIFYGAHPTNFDFNRVSLMAVMELKDAGYEFELRHLLI